jgi:molecular chaperone IbpA
MLCVHLILLPSIVPPLVLISCFQCSIKSAAWKAPGYPPYNIKRSGENAYNISVAVAGFTGADLSIEVKENVLTIRGNKQSSGEEESDPVYQGIAERNFERKFHLADHVQIKGASLENGLLQVDLLRVVPAAMKPRAIPITTAKKALLEGKAAKIAA